MLDDEKVKEEMSALMNMVDNGRNLFFSGGSEDFEKIYSETQIIIKIRNGVVYFVIILSSSIDDL